jgi:hypothetical protein
VRVWEGEESLVSSTIHGELDHIQIKVREVWVSKEREDLADGPSWFQRTHRWSWAMESDSRGGVLEVWPF